MKLIKSAVLCIVALTTFHSYANENGENVIYLGGGSSKTDSYGKSSGTAVTLGFIKQSNASDTFFGGDISGEGTKYHNGNPEKSTSFNLIIGKNLNKTENGRFDGGLLIGFREKSSSCPTSYIGYQCYADSEPSTKYGANFGALLTYTHKSLILGIRATGESKQLIVGFKY
jgi:hypothetical protein